MIRQVRGVVAWIGVTDIILDVQGIGYLVHLAEPGVDYAVGETISLHTHLAVRENAMDLYGFSSHEHLEVFEILLSLPKVGPKSAQQIMSQIDIRTLRQAVAEQDPSYLSKISGVGKKTAEKIVFGLKDLLDYDDADTYSAKEHDAHVPSVVRDTIDALTTLGYAPDEARRASRKASEEHPDEADTATLLKHALSLLS